MRCKKMADIGRCQFLRGGALAVALAVLAGPAMADATLHVFLWSSGKGAIDAMNHKIGDKASPLAATMGVTPDVTTVPAGKVTFKVLTPRRRPFTK